MKPAILSMTRHAVALASAVMLVACSRDSTGPAIDPSPSAAASAPGGTSASSDTGGVKQGEWHLQTIRGVLLGLERSTTGDTSAANTTPVANATVEIHKISLAVTPAEGADSAAQSLKDLGIVATLTTDAAGKFEYVLADPIVVKTGVPSPLITYRLTVTPPPGSPFAAQSGMQVLFAEQIGGDGVVHYYLFRPKS
jgi:hypothetical protein